jgi:hypothetical protein
MRKPTYFGGDDVNVGVCVKSIILGLITLSIATSTQNQDVYRWMISIAVAGGVIFLIGTIDMMFFIILALVGGLCLFLSWLVASVARSAFRECKRLLYS